MNAVMLGLFAETPVHSGSGRSMGVVDLPVAREGATDYPVIVGSSLKGALRDRAKAFGRSLDECFGTPNQAGELAISDARLLLLPVRSLTSSFRWLTCPHLLERFSRDLARIGRSTPFSAPRVDANFAMANSHDRLFLEEREFEVERSVPSDVIEALGELISHAASRTRLQDRLVVVNDDDFAWFARYGLPIQARNQLGDNKTSENLWYEETVPSETLFYTIVIGRRTSPMNDLTEIFPEGKRYLQVGGNETIGQGWLSVKILGAEDGQ